MNNSNNIKENDIQQDDVLPEGFQLLNDPLQENINSIFNDKQTLSSTTYLNISEVMALNNNTHQTNQFQQPTIIEFFISNNSPNINQSTILGIDNMKQISQSIMGLPINEDINVNASLSKSKLSFGSIENDYLKYENKTEVPQNEITFLKSQNDTQKLRDYVLNELTIKPDFQTSIGPISSLEHLVEISKGNNVLLKNEMQKKFDDLKGLGGRKLSYDFFLPHNNLLIEFQGEQHEKPVVFKGLTKKKAEEKFIKQQEHDRRKREYAQSHDIKLLEIWYYELNLINEILAKELDLDISKFA